MLPDQKLVNGHISVEPLPPHWLLYCKSADRVHLSFLEAKAEELASLVELLPQCR